MAVYLLLFVDYVWDYTDLFVGCIWGDIDLFVGYIWDYIDLIVGYMQFLLWDCNLNRYFLLLTCKLILAFVVYRVVDPSMRKRLYHGPRYLALLNQDQEQAPHPRWGGQHLPPDPHQRTAGLVCQSYDVILLPVHGKSRNIVIVLSGTSSSRKSNPDQQKKSSR